MNKLLILALGVSLIACSKPSSNVSTTIDPNNGDQAQTVTWKIARVCPDGTYIYQKDGGYFIWSAGSGQGDAGTWTPLADGVTPANICKGDPPSTVGATNGT